MQHKMVFLIHLLIIVSALLSAFVSCGTNPTPEQKNSVKLELQSVEENQINLHVSITTASDVNFAYIHYAIEGKDESYTKFLTDAAAGSNYVQLSGLAKNTTYLLTAYADIDGAGEIKSDVLTAKTGAPVQLELVEKTEESITIRVNVLSPMEIYAKGFTWKKFSSKDIPENVVLPNEQVSEYTISNLEKNTTYTFEAYAILEGSDKSYKSETMNVFTGNTEVPDGDWVLVFDQEFNTDNEDLTRVWSFEEGYSIRNNENQFYSKSKENAFTKDGYLHIVARRNHLGSDGKTWDYTSASMTTSKSFVYCYGRVEVRAKIPTGGGMWPAIWQVGNMYTWPQNGELDIMEYYREGIKANAAWGSTQNYKPVWDSSNHPMTYFEAYNPNWRNEFHVWRFEWDYDNLDIYLDDELMKHVNVEKTVNGGVGGNYENPYRYHKTGFGHYLWLDLAIGGNNGGTIDNSLFPAEYLVDYVRVYQKTRLPENGNIVKD